MCGSNDCTLCRATSWLTSLLGSFRSPKMRARALQVFTQAGCRPWSTRCMQKSHFWAVCVRGSMYFTPYGQACTQYLQPMQVLSSCTTMPSARCHVAPVGHPETQGGSSQWLHSTGTKLRTVFGNSPFSLWITQDLK